MEEPIGKSSLWVLGYVFDLGFHCGHRCLIPLQQVFPGKAARTELDEK